MLISVSIFSWIERKLKWEEIISENVWKKLTWEKWLMTDHEEEEEETADRILVTMNRAHHKVICNEHRHSHSMSINIFGFFCYFFVIFLLSLLSLVFFSNFLPSESVNFDVLNEITKKNPFFYFAGKRHREESNGGGDSKRHAPENSRNLQLKLFNLKSIVFHRLFSFSFQNHS